MTALDEAKAELNGVVQNLLYYFLEEFDKNYFAWKQAVACAAELDCILSLAQTSTSGEMCRPVFRASSKDMLKLEGVYHPCLSAK